MKNLEQNLGIVSNLLSICITKIKHKFNDKSSQPNSIEHQKQAENRKKKSNFKTLHLHTRVFACAKIPA